MTSLNETPSANRFHIGFFGKRNSGKSSLINALAGQEASIVSDVAGTTTDPVYKAIEISGLGASVLIDTAGFDDIGPLGEIRVEKTKKAADKSDLAVILFSGDQDITMELRWSSHFKERGTPVIHVISKSDISDRIDELSGLIENMASSPPMVISAVTLDGVEALRARIAEILSVSVSRTILGDMVNDGDVVLLVMPMDIQAPAGRLILPQVQTIRELLDRKCVVMCVTQDRLDKALSSLNTPPALIITDSQAFGEVYAKKPQESGLTSFSLLFAAYKGDLAYYLESVKKVGELTEQSKVLIAECCTHAPMDEDIGRVKIPRMLRKKIGERLSIDIAGGADFPDDLSDYDLIIQCGGCMFNRRHVMSRIDRAREQNIPMTNYGVLLAYFSGIIDKVALPVNEK